MNDHSTRDRATEAAGGLDPRRSAGRVVAVDAARGLALVGMTAVHFLPDAYPDNDRPTLSWLLFAGDSAALFALLAGVALALVFLVVIPALGLVLGAAVGIDMGTAP